MDFSERLNLYMAEIGCSAKNLSESSGISTAAISRYRKGERIPDPDGRQLHLLADGIANLSNDSLDARQVHEELATAISGIAVDYGTFLANLGALLEALPANNNEIARALSFDPSYISRILAGQRRPADTRAFVAGVASFASRRYAQKQPTDKMLELANANWADIPDDDERARAIADWLGTNYLPPSNPIGSFLEKLDAFNLDDFIRTVQFDGSALPPTPDSPPAMRVYEGIREMMACELDFLQATVQSKSSADIIMYSEMPLLDMATDPEFPRAWMSGMAMVLKKGLRFHMIHDTSRPLAEMMLGLESWIPMYMTGQIMPYYLEQGPSGPFLHLLKASGSVAVQGEAVVGYQAEGRYVLACSRDEVRYYRRRAERLLERARPLMHIVTKANAEKLAGFLDADIPDGARLRIIMSTLPLGTIPPELLERMLERNGVGETDRQAIRELAQVKAARFDDLASHCEITLDAPDFPPEEFEAHAPALELADLFSEVAVPYSREEYAEHLAALRRSVADRPNCALEIDRRPAFRNVQIIVHEGRSVLVSKNASPVIHFVIEHPDMVAAFERFSTAASDVSS